MIVWPAGAPDDKLRRDSNPALIFTQTRAAPILSPEGFPPLPAESKRAAVGSPR
jgi:hypothetical protein